MSAVSLAPKLVTEAQRRRLRATVLVAALVTVVVGLAAIAVGATQRQSAAETVPVLMATRAIQAGSKITADELTVTTIAAGDRRLVASLVSASDDKKLVAEEQSLVGHVAAIGLSAGEPVPLGLVAQGVTSGLWEISVPVKRAPSDLAAGDYVALLMPNPAGGDQQGIVIPDVQVIAVGSGSVDVWLSPKLVGQVEFAADHGGIVVARMEPGAGAP